MKSKINIKIMNTVPEVSDEEIGGYMDFNRLIADHESALRKHGVIRKGISLVALAVVVSVGVLLYNRSDEGKPARKQLVVADSSTVKTSPNKTIENKHLALQEDTTHSGKSVLFEEKEMQRKPETKARLKEQPKDKRADADSVDSIVVPTDTAVLSQSDDSSAREYSYTQAEPIDGYPSLFEYLRANIKYPEDAVMDSVQGVITVTFAVDANGTIEDIHIQDILGSSFVEQNLTVIQNMPAWKPALLNGRPIKSKMSLPLTFRILPK